MKYSKLVFQKKRGLDYCFVEYLDTETSDKREVYDVTNTKKSNQPLNKELDDCRMRLEAHLMFASEFIDNTINLDENMDYEKYFKEFQHQQDSRFDGVDVTKVDFIYNKEGEFSAVKITGTKTTQTTDKPFKNTFSTPVINLNKESDNYYKLVSILDEQINDMIVAIDKWMERGFKLRSSQQSLKIV